MSRVRILLLGAAVCSALCLTAASASALTIGASPFPSTGLLSGCEKLPLIQGATEPGYQYPVPTGGGQITSWSTEAVPTFEGAPITLLVVRPSGGGTDTIVGLDSETLPVPIPSGGIVTFNLAKPIAVNAGDRLGLDGTSCYFATSNMANTVTVGAVNSLNVGGIYTPSIPETAGYVADVSANLVQSEDTAVSAAAATPASITAGGLSEYLFTVANNGLGAEPITFTDTVPSGLGVISAVAGSGSCTVAGQTVACTISGLQAGQSAPVAILVSAAAAGTYPDTASVAGTDLALTDPNPANNSATATLTVAAPAPPACQTLRLAKFPLSIARAVLPGLHCKLGKVKLKASKTIRKGLVISTSPGAGVTLANGTAVNLVVSSGPPRKKRKK